MLKELSLKNFKTFNSIKNVEFKPITVLCGANNTGKSNLVKSLLLLKQTLSCRKLESGLLFNGELAKLGNYTNTVFNYNDDESMEISVKFDFKDLKEILKKSRFKTILKEFFYIDTDNNPEKTISYKFQFKIYNDEVILSKLHIEGNDIHIDLEHIEKHKYMLNFKNVCGLKGDDLKVIAVFEKYLIPDVLIPLNDDRYTQKELSDIRRFVDMTCHYSYVLFESLMDKISYISSLRKEPERNYIYEKEIYSIGTMGENTAYIYNRMKDEKINLYFYDEQKSKFGLESCKLSKALSKWLNAMDIDGFENTSRNEIIKMNVKKDSGLKINIADMGIGFNQVLPILTEGLRIKQGQTLLVEHPENNLYSKNQLQLADFFIAMAMDNKNSVIETNSEHLINRLILRSLKDKEIAKLINIYYIDENANLNLLNLDNKAGLTEYHKLISEHVLNEQNEVMDLIASKTKTTKTKEKTSKKSDSKTKSSPKAAAKTTKSKTKKSK